jgi:hypothetical protein
MMMFASESTATFNAGPESSGSRGTSCRKPPRTWSAHTAAVVAKLREFAPYAAMELVLPRSRTTSARCHAHERASG